MEGWPRLIGELMRQVGAPNQRDFAARLGTPASTVSGWMKGRHDPDDASIAKMATLTGTTPNDLRRRVLEAASVDDDLFPVLAARFRELGPLDQADVLHDVLRRHAQRKGGAA
jgi:transcriptional regulator with XRE-family HTH domain